jgi:hypothetical protein
MGVDIENPEADGCVAAAEPSRNSFWTLKERLVAAFLGNPNGAGGGDADDQAAEAPNGVADGDTVADVPEAKPVKRGWRNYVLCVCSVIFLLVSIASVYPFTQAKDREHLVLWGIGVFGGFLVAKVCVEIAILV